MTISEETVGAIKAAMRIEEVVQDFVVLKPKGTNLIGLCPFHNDRNPSFYIKPSDQICKCFSCGEGGDALHFLMNKKADPLSYPAALLWLAKKYNITVEEESKVYVLPPWRNKTTLPENLVKWFEGRKISQNTLQKMKICFDNVWMPQLEKEVPCVQFPYFRDDVLVNIKSRDKQKNFCLNPKSELIFYNLDSIKGKKEVFIVEGEPDCLSLVEAGYMNDTMGVISVPNGAGVKTNNLAYLDSAMHLFEGIEKIHIGTDNDIPGRALREQLAERFGKERCDIIEWKDKKDANEVLVQYGITGIIECCGHPHNFPLEGVFTVSDFAYEIDDMYVNGLEKGVSIKLWDFSLRFVPGYFTTITGIPSHGKSNFVDELTMRLLVYHGWRGGFYSPENKPIQLHFSKLARRLTGKHWDEGNRITQDEKQQVKDFLEKKVFFIKPERDFSLTSILNSIRELKRAYGIKWFVIDAWNKLEHKAGKDMFYVGRCLDELSIFCEAEQVHGFLVAHPTKIEKDRKTGEYPVPTLYNISGSADFYNKSDNGISVYRDFKKEEVHVHIQKVKFDHWGWVDKATYKYEKESMRYYCESRPETTNWITGAPVHKPPPEKVEQEELFKTDEIVVMKTAEESEKAPF